MVPRISLAPYAVSESTNDPVKDTYLTHIAPDGVAAQHPRTLQEDHLGELSAHPLKVPASACENEVVSMHEAA